MLIAAPPAALAAALRGQLPAAPPPAFAINAAPAVAQGRCLPRAVAAWHAQQGARIAAEGVAAERQEPQPQPKAAEVPAMPEPAAPAVVEVTRREWGAATWAEHATPASPPATEGDASGVAPDGVKGVEP